MWKGLEEALDDRFDDDGFPQVCVNHGSQELQRRRVSAVTVVFCDASGRVTLALESLVVQRVRLLGYAPLGGGVDLELDKGAKDSPQDVLWKALERELLEELPVSSAKEIIPRLLASIRQNRSYVFRYFEAGTQISLYVPISGIVS